MADLTVDPKKITAMVVDDHDPIRKAVRRAFQKLEFANIIECFDGRDAIEALNNQPIDIVVCDLYMRNVDGFEVLNKIRNRAIASDIPVIIVTGEGSRDEIVKAVDLGANDYLLKPFQLDDLLKKISDELNRYHTPTKQLKMQRMAERLYLEKDYVGAEKMFSSIISTNPTNSNAAHCLALSLLKQKKTPEAMKVLEKNISNNETFFRSFRTLADIHLNAGDIFKAVGYMKSELNINPKQPKRQVQVAKILMKEGDNQGAIEHFRQALLEQPKYRSALMGMGQAYAKADNLDKSLYYFKRVRRYHPNYTKALEAAISIAMTMGEPQRAIYFLKDIIKVQPKNTDSYIVLAKLQVKLEKEIDAMETLDSLVKLEPENPQAYHMRGLIMLRLGNHTQAAEELTKACTLDPTSENLNLLAEAQIGARQFRESIQTLNQSIKSKQKNPHAYLLLGNVYMMTQEYRKAFHIYLKASQLEADKKRCNQAITKCFHLINESRQAIAKPKAAS